MTGPTALAAAAIGPGGFALVVWGSIALVLAAFVYVVAALIRGREASPGP